MSLERLPDDTLFVVFSFMNTKELTLLCTASKQNWQVSELARSERVWKDVYDDFERATYQITELNDSERKRLDGEKSSFGKYQVLRLAHYLHPKQIKVVLVGDVSVGKTILFIRYIHNKYTSVKYLPRHSNKVKKVNYNGKIVGIDLWDTSIGGADRPEVIYQDTDVFILCFSVMNPTSFMNLRTKWYKEVREYCKDAKIIICGNKSDLRSDEESLLKLKNQGMSPVDYGDMEKLRDDLGAYACIETSASRRRNTFELFLLCLDSVHSGKMIDRVHRGVKKKKKKGKGGCLVM